MSERPLCPGTDESVDGEGDGVVTYKLRSPDGEESDDAIGLTFSGSSVFWDRSIGSAPNALALFNPATVLAPVPGVFEPNAERAASLAERMGGEECSGAFGHPAQVE